MAIRLINRRLCFLIFLAVFKFALIKRPQNLSATERLGWLNTRRRDTEMKVRGLS